MSGRGPDVYFRDPEKITGSCVIEAAIVIDGEVVAVPLDAARAAGLAAHVSGNLARHLRKTTKGGS